MSAAAPRLDPRLIAVLAVLAILAIAVPLAIVRFAPPVRMPAPVAAAKPPQRVIPKAELPPVEPTAFVVVDVEDARAYNASIPFSSAPVLPARPFRIVGGEDDVARAVDCMASAVLYEAGDDPVGQRAVAQVVINRVRHPAFPKSVCGVVFQGAERSTGCQFTFTCDGALARRYSAAAWDRAQDMAKKVLAGAVEKKVGLATHYHTDWVVPYWSASLDKVSEVDTHLFFRWTGWWGTPPAFRGRYAGAEPAIAKLAPLSPAHGRALPEAVVADAAAMTARELPDAAMPSASAVDPNSFLVTLDPRLSPGEFPAFALRVCGERPYCKLLAWASRADTPALLPARPAALERMAFSYLRDRGRGFEKALWNCERYERPDLAQCMKGRVALPSARGAPVDMLPGAGLRAALGLGNRSAAEPPALGGVRRKTGTLAPMVPAPAATPRSEPLDKSMK